MSQMNESNDISEIPFIRIFKKNGQLFLNKIKFLFKNESILNNKFEPLLEKKFISFPLKNDDAVINKVKDAIEGIIDFQIIFKKGIVNKQYKFKSIKEAIEGHVSDKYHPFIPRSYDIIGDIAILEFERNKGSFIEDISHFKGHVAKALCNINRNVKTVFEKTSDVKGSYRLRELSFLCGENKSLTRHKENDCVFEVDVKTTFFTPRLVFERKRIASMDFNLNENIMDLFAGVGPFSIQIVKKNRTNVFAFDINPNAYNLLINNINLNKLKGSIIPFNIDIKSLLNPSSELGASLKNKADRIIMNLPEKSIDFLDVACHLLKKSGGIIHNYQFSEKPNPVERSIENLKKNLGILNFKIQEIIESKIVKQFSPKVDLVVVDFLINRI